VVVARTKAIHTDFGKLTQNYLSACEKLGLLKEDSL
jgi:hypothetical protein